YVTARQGRPELIHRFHRLHRLICGANTPIGRATHEGEFQICEIAKSVDVFPLPQGSSSGFGKHFAAGAGDEGGDDAGRGLFAEELHGAIGAERVGAAGVERVDLIHVVAVDAAAAAVPNGAVLAEAADADGGVVVGPGGVEGPADLARAVRLNRLALGI